MVTVFPIVSKYCEENNRPSPTKDELKNIGAICSYHFRKYWCADKSDEVISQAGFVRSEENGETLVVIKYPDGFESEIALRTHQFYSNKPTAKEVSETPVKAKRKRIPAKATKIII